MTRSTFVVNGHASTDATFPRVTTCDAQSTSDTAQPQLDEPHKPRCNIQLLLGITRVLLGVLCVFMEILIAVLYSAAAGYQGFWAGPFMIAAGAFQIAATRSPGSSQVAKLPSLVSILATVLSFTAVCVVFGLSRPWYHPDGTIQPSLLALVLVQATGFILEVLLSVIQGVATLRRRFCCYPAQTSRPESNPTNAVEMTSGSPEACPTAPEYTPQGTGFVMQPGLLSKTVPVISRDITVYPEDPPPPYSLQDLAPLHGPLGSGVLYSSQHSSGVNEGFSSDYDYITTPPPTYTPKKD